MPLTSPPSALPPVNCAPVTTRARLDYVLQHFALAYDEVPAGLIGYPGSNLAIEVAEAAGSFFEEQKPYPAAPNNREWAGCSVPFFFDAQPAAPLLTFAPGHVRINADVLAAAFYLLSGWQEYFSSDRDRHGRFPYAASVQQQYGFVALPVVNYYFDVLKTAVEHVSGQALRLRHWRSAPFAAFISHDVDLLRSAWKTPAKAALKNWKFFAFGRQLWRRFTQPDAWDNLALVAKSVAAYGSSSTFFMLPQSRPGADGTPNADYVLTAALRQHLGELARQGSEIGLHGSIGTATSSTQLQAEAGKLQAAGRGLRFHYLRWEPRLTPAIIERANCFSYDSTLGFAEHFGFRHSYCHPFYPFNFTTGTGHGFIEIPLQVMDTTLHHPSYLQLQPDEILPALQPMFDEVAKFGGVATVLWHNNHFDPANTNTGPRQFAEIMDCLRAQGAAFLTGEQIVAELCRT